MRRMDVDEYNSRNAHISPTFLDFDSDRKKERKRKREKARAQAARARPTTALGGTRIRSKY